jgi:hypothetical protein
LRPVGASLPQGLGGLALERAHFVLFFALDLVGDAQMAHGVGAQVESVEVSGGVSGDRDAGGGSGGGVVRPAGRGLAAGCRQLKASGVNEVAGAGKKVEVGKADVMGKGIGHVAAHAQAGLGEQLVEQAQATFAFEAKRVEIPISVSCCSASCWRKSRPLWKMPRHRRTPVSNQVASSRAGQSRRCLAACKKSKRSLKNSFRKIELQ